MASLGIVTTVVAQPDLHVFIPVDETIVKLKELLERHEVVFVRAGVSSGKSTMVRYMADMMPDEFVQVESQESDMAWYRSIVQAAGGDAKAILQADESYAVEALKSIGKAGKVILIDEAHNLFSHEAPMNLIINKPRDWNEDERPRILLFSAAASGRRAGKAGEPDVIINTPKEIKKVLWYPPLPDVDSLAEQLERARVYLSEESVRLFMHFCAGRRGVFMQAMEWVKECQDKETEPKTWECSDTIAYVKESLEENRTAHTGEWTKGLLSHLKQSRAVKVNHWCYYDLKNIPAEFVTILFEGSRTATELPELRRSVRTLTILGFLLPERDQGDEREFIDCDWTSNITRYGVSSPVMALYYQHVFKDYDCEVIPDKKIPTSAADLTARFIPYLSFATVVDNSIPCQKDGELRSSLNSKGKPSEEDYNGAIAQILFDLKYSIAKPQNRDGKTDVVLISKGKNLVALESVLAAQDEKKIREHAGRFYKRDHTEAIFKGLLIIGGDAAKVNEAMSVAKKYIEQKVKQGGTSVEVIGLLHSSTYDGFHMVLDEKKRPLFFTCDRVARSLEEGGEKHVSAQQLKKNLKRKIDDIPA